MLWFFEGFYQICWASIVISDHSRHGGIVQTPSFSQEPPPQVVFSNNTGAHITCSAHGSPIPLITWLTKDGSVVNTVPGLRLVAKFSCSYKTWQSETIFIRKGWMSSSFMSFCSLLLKHSLAFLWKKTHIKMFLRPEMSIFTFKNNHKLMYKRTKGLCEVIDKLSKRPKRPT